MIPEIWEGVFGGLFGGNVARWLGKYKYYVAFFVGFSLIPIFFGAIAIFLGWKAFIQRSAPSFPQDVPLILGLSILMGLAFIAIVAIGRWEIRMKSKIKDEFH